MSMDHISLLAEGLTAYAIERQNGIERNQPPDTPPWAEQRRGWIEDILQNYSEMDGTVNGKDLINSFDKRLEQAGKCFAVEPASVKLQRDTIRSLQSYASKLEHQPGDPRHKMMNVYKLLEDMIFHLSWNSRVNGLWDAISQLEQALPRLTARQPIRFTRILLGGEIGPGDTGFVSGTVSTAEEVMDTELYAEVSQRYPEVDEWPAVCVIYNCGEREMPFDVRDATEFDLELMRMAGVRFLDLPGLRWCGTSELRCSTEPDMTIKM